MEGEPSTSRGAIPKVKKTSIDEDTIEEVDVNEETSLQVDQESQGMGEKNAEETVVANAYGCCSGLKQRIDKFLSRIGICTCAVHECMGKSKSCKVCNTRKMKRYNKLEDDYYKVEFGEEVNQTQNLQDLLIIKFHLESPEVRDTCPLLVTKNMSAFSVVRSIAVNMNTADFYRYSISEFWTEFEAARTLEEHELVLSLRHQHMRSRQRIIFVYHRDLDKFEYIKHKQLFFVHPDEARAKNRKKKQNSDPSFIQIWDPFFCKPTDPREHIPQQSSKPSTPEKPTSSRQATVEKVEVHTEEKIIEFSKCPEDDLALPLLESVSNSVDVSTVESHESETELSTSKREELSSVSDGSVSVAVGETDEDEPDFYNVQNDFMVNPIFCGTVFVKQGDRDLTVAEARKLPNEKEKARWSKKYLLLRDRILYYVDDHENMLELYYMNDTKFAQTGIYNCRPPNILSYKTYKRQYKSNDNSQQLPLLSLLCSLV